MKNYQTSDNDLITIPSNVRDWLIFLASSRVRPFAPVFATRSFPAKSAKFNFESFVDPSRNFHNNN